MLHHQFLNAVNDSSRFCFNILFKEGTNDGKAQTF